MMPGNHPLPIATSPRDFTAESTVGGIVAANPAASRVFEHFGIDYCCAGRVSLADAAASRGIRLEELIEALSRAERPPLDQEPDWSSASMTALADHIEQKHHGLLRRELPRLRAMTTKVAAVHGGHHPEMVEVAEIFDSFADELEAHMLKEEHVLFPLLREFERTGQAPAGVEEGPIAGMIHEHDEAGQALRRMRELTADFTPPHDACATYRATLEGLEALERDMHRHVHKENSILFPMAVKALPR